MADQCENKIKKSERFIYRPHCKEEEKNRIVSGGNGSKKNGDRSERSRKEKRKVIQLEKRRMAETRISDQILADKDSRNYVVPCQTQEKGEHEVESCRATKGDRIKPSSNVLNISSRGKRMVEIARSKGKAAKAPPPVKAQEEAIPHVIPRPSSKKVQHKMREVNPDLISRLSDQPLGSGSYGTCFLATYRGISVAVKEIKQRDDSPKEKERARREVVHEANVLHQLGDHPGLPLLFGVCSLHHPFKLIIQFHGVGTKSLTLLKAV